MDLKENVVKLSDELSQIVTQKEVLEKRISLLQQEEAYFESDSKNSDPPK